MIYRILRLFFLAVMGLVVQTLEGQVILTSSNLPIVLLETNGQEIPEDEKINIDMKLIYHGPGVINHIDDNVYNYNGLIAIKKRGSSSIVFPKSSYSFETIDDSGANQNVSLIDLPEENDWVLYGPYADKSLMRNILIYELARRIGWYAPRTRMCEVMLNDEYIGVYVLIEKIKRDENRVNITKLTQEDTTGANLTGGYILQVDRHEGGGWLSLINNNIYFQYIYPDEEEILPVQESYIQQRINDLEAFLQSCTQTDQDSIENSLNTANFIDYIILNELAKNMDAYRLSTYVYKNNDCQDPRIHVGPIWDYNIAFGNFESHNGWETSGFVYNDTVVLYYPFTLFWFRKLMELEFFQDQFTARWDTLSSAVFHPDSIHSIIDSVAYFVEEAQARNFEQWDILGQYIWPNYYIGSTYEEEVLILKEWLAGRIEWINGEITDTPEIRFPAQEKVPVYPQPVHDHFTIDLKSPAIAWVELSLFDARGMEVYKRKLHPDDANRVSVTIGDLYLPAGIYLFTCLLDDARVFSGKLVKD